MKKIALLLALIFVLSVFAACNGNSTDDNFETPSDASSNASDESTDPNDPPKIVYTGVSVRENPYSTVISNGASYTKDLEADAQYEDTYGTELTDSIRSSGGGYGDVGLSGYIGTTNVIVDLGTLCDKLYAFEVGYLCYNEAGVHEPNSISVSASIDGDRWTNVGSLTKPTGELGSVMTARLDVPGYIQARYLRFRIGNSGGWIFIDEVSAIADIEDTGRNTQYAESIMTAYETLGSVQKPVTDVAIDRNLDKVLVSKDCKYTIDGDIKNFKDSGKMLTDGKLSGYFEGETWVGFDPSKDTTVTINLGKNLKDVALIEANFYTNTAVNIYLPVAVKVAALDKDKNRTDLGVLYGNTVIDNGSYCFSLPLDTAISARYIELTFLATESNVFLVEELAVYAYREDEEKTLYPPVELVEDDSEWGSDGNSEYTNLIMGKTQQIIASDTPAEEHIASNTKVNSKLLTDGVRAVSTDIHCGRYFKFLYGGSRSVIYDLEHLSAVDKFTASFVQKEEWAVKRPNSVKAYVFDGSEWYLAGEIELVDSGTDDNATDSIYIGELVLDKPVNARYVAFAFDVNGWVGCDELEVFGTKKSNGTSAESLGLKETPGFFSTKRIEPSDDILDGTKDLCLMYHSKGNYYVADDLVPYLAYVDAEGKPVDVMFDNLLFLFNNTNFPSGGSPHNGSVMSDWQWTIDDLYHDGRNVIAMEEAAGQIKSALGLEADYKFKYTVTLYYPYKYDDNGSVVAYNFGDVDGDGTPENTGNFDDRVKIMKWYIDAIEAINAEKNFQNIELVGYYWWHEALENGDKDGIALLNKISDMVHETDKEFFWIPYFCSNGYNLWSDCGFDVACMQPNYVFKLETPYSNVYNCAQLTQTFGMGYEMEVFEDALTNKLFYKKYMEYLGSGATLGYMNDTIVMYYQSVSVFKNAAYSDSTMARNIYDQTYHFIKGDLEYNPEAITGLTYETEKNSILKGEITFEGDLLRQYQVVSMPDHGTVTMNEDGSFTYYPEKDYTGEVKFTFAYNEYLGWSDPCEVTITVK